MQKVDIQLKTILMAFQSRTRMIYGKVEGLFYTVSSISSLKKEAFLTEPSEIQTKLNEFIKTNKALLDNGDLAAMKDELTHRITKIKANTTGLLAIFRFFWNPNSLKQLYNHREILEKLMESVEEALAATKAPKNQGGKKPVGNPGGTGTPQKGTPAKGTPQKGTHPKGPPAGGTPGKQPPPGTPPNKARPLPTPPGTPGTPGKPGSTIPIPKPPPGPPPAKPPPKPPAKPVVMNKTEPPKREEFLAQIKQGKKLKSMNTPEVDSAVKNNPIHKAIQAHAHLLRNKVEENDNPQKDLEDWDSTSD